MTRYFVQDTSLTAIADAIRAKTGGTAALTLDGMAEAVAGIEAGGGGVSCIDGFTVESGAFTPAESITDQYVIRPQMVCKNTTSRGRLFICWRNSHLVSTDTRGISTIGAIPMRNNVDSYAFFGGYVGGAGTSNNNLNNHSLSASKEAVGETFAQVRYVYTINCSSTAPLSANQYLWLLAVPNEGVVQ